jgi:hypothetical protein
LFSPDGREANILSFSEPSGLTYYAAFDALGGVRNQVKSYSQGTVSDFFARHAASPVTSILRQPA